MSGATRHHAVGLTHQGCVRTLNEDSHLIRDDAGLWVVADGMGGLERGEVASAAIVDALGHVPLDGELERNLPRINAKLVEVNADLNDLAKKSGGRLGSTVVALHIEGAKFACLWAGDSRLYRLRSGKLERISRDHTQVQEMFDRGLITRDEIRGHPLGHVISRCVGIDPRFMPETIQGALAPSDVFLLCSDGLSGPVTDAEIEAYLLGAEPAEACRRLLDLALDRGAPDNVTIVAVSSEAP